MSLRSHIFIKIPKTFKDEMMAKLKGTELSVYLCLALRFGEGLREQPSLVSICQETGYCKTTVIAALDNLENLGLVEWKKVRCSLLLDRLQLFMTINVHFDNREMVALADCNGIIYTPQDWAELSAMVDEFYNSVPSYYIEEFNNKRLNEMSGPPKTGKTEERNKYGCVYLLKAGPYYKIGVSTDVSKRIERLSTLPPFDLELVLTIQTNDPFGLEKHLHDHFADRRKQGEWFELSEQDVEAVKEWMTEHEIRQHNGS